MATAQRGVGLAAVALGSNLDSTYGDRKANLKEAIRRLASLGQVRAVSSLYDTQPVGYVAQPRFLNAAALLETSLEPLPLLRAMLAVEREMGRVRTIDQGPRTIDLDLLLYDALILESEELRLPHPEMHARLFVLEPLAEIAPGMVHPLLKMSVAELRDRLRGPAL